MHKEIREYIKELKGNFRDGLIVQYAEQLLDENERWAHANKELAEQNRKYHEENLRLVDKNEQLQRENKEMREGKIGIEEYYSVKEERDSWRRVAERLEREKQTAMKALKDIRRLAKWDDERVQIDKAAFEALKQIEGDGE